MSKGDFHLYSYATAETSFDIHPLKDSPRGAKVCVVIGPNGSGKSRLAGGVVRELILVNSLRNGSSLSESPKVSDGTRPNGSTLVYRQAGRLCRIIRKWDRLYGWLDEVPASVDEMPFPSKLLAVAHLPADRFYFTHTVEDEFYSYLGLRQATNMTTTGALEHKVMLSLFRGIRQPYFSSNLALWLSMLGLSGPARLRVQFVDKAVLQIARVGDFDSFWQYVLQRLSRRAGSTRQSQDYTRTYGADIKVAWMLLRRLSIEPTVDGGRSETLSVSISTESFESELTPVSWEHSIEGLRRLRLTSDLGLEFNKSGNTMRFSDLSSGEQQILGTFTRVLAEIRDDCVIFIDEPEVSLHPSWQIRYIPTLLDALKNFPSTQVVITTHSHFLVSDVEAQRTTLVVADGDKSRDFRLFEGDVFGRSPENILYRVFGVGTSGNFYVERDLTLALQMISGQTLPQTDELSKILLRLERIGVKDNEAFATIVGEIRNFLMARIR